MKNARIVDGQKKDGTKRLSGASSMKGMLGPIIKRAKSTADLKLEIH